jgi:hypothetical protein
MEPIDYLKVALQKRNLKGEFRGNRVKASHVVGSGVEAILKLVYRPKKAEIPLLLEDLEASCLNKVMLHDVLCPEGREPRSVLVKVHEQDASLALEVVRAIFEILQRAPYHLQVHAVDHQGPGGQDGAHDLFTSPFPGLRSVLPGMRSTEIRLREVKTRQPATMNWEKTLQEECLPLFKAAAAKTKQGSLAGRLLGFVELNHPCHDGPFRVHGSSYTIDKGWERLWGWWGFGPQYKIPVDDAADIEPLQKKIRVESTSAAGSSGSASRPQQQIAMAKSMPLRPQARDTPQQQWDAAKRALRIVRGWVFLPHFLRHVGKPQNQAKRYLEPGHKFSWRSPTGGRF